MGGYNIERFCVVVNSKDKIAVFTTVNFNYIKYAIKCFELLEAHNPGVFDFHIITSAYISQTAFKSSIKVNYIKEDLHNAYRVETNWPYPPECFWLFRGPDIMRSLGYKHSMYIDADVVCTKRLDLDWLQEDFVLAGASRMKVSNWQPNTVFDFFRAIEKRINIIEENFSLIGENTASINSGVLFFNNHLWVQEQMFRISVECFKKAKDLGVPRKGDDSLLALVQLVTPSNFYKILSPNWNYYYERPNANSRGKMEEIILMHMTAFKPWRDIKELKLIKNTNIKRTCLMWHKYNTDFMENNKPKKPSHVLWWYRAPKSYNFGDEITPWLFEKMFGIRQDKPGRLTASNVLLAVGSIMRLANGNTEVWGSGIRNIDQMDFQRARKFHAVRGLFSRKRLLERGYDCPEVYGDPGLLLPDFYNPSIDKKYKLGVIPHIVDFAELNDHFGQMDGVKVINLETDNIEGVVRDILECEHIVSTSLHGIITAVAYNVPTRWFKCSDKINGDGIKFYDFFSSLDHEVFNKFDRRSFKAHDDKYNPLYFDKLSSLTDICDQTYLYEFGDFDKEKLYKACPFRMF